MKKLIILTAIFLLAQACNWTLQDPGDTSDILGKLVTESFVSAFV